MKKMWLVGVLASVFFAANAAIATGQGGATSQVPAGQTVLGTVSIPRAVMADGKQLAAGSYTLRLTAETAQPAPGQNASLERWVEFLRSNKVVGRELVSIVPAEEVKDTMPGPDMPGKVGKTGSRV